MKTPSELISEYLTAARKETIKSHDAKDNYRATYLGATVYFEPLWGIKQGADFASIQILDVEIVVFGGGDYSVELHLSRNQLDAGYSLDLHSLLTDLTEGNIAGKGIEEYLFTAITTPKYVDMLRDASRAEVIPMTDQDKEIEKLNETIRTLTNDSFVLSGKVEVLDYLLGKVTITKD